MTRTRALLLGATALTLGLVLADLARHPAVRAEPAAALLVTRQAAPLGEAFGGLVAALWMVEIWAGNLAPPGRLTLIVYRASTACVLLASLGGGRLGGLTGDGSPTACPSARSAGC